jgi:copper homeostasis protein
MVRPRPSGFHYSPADLEAMLHDAELFVEYGADGLVFGPLTATGEIEEASVRRLVKAARGKQTVIHRAFDITPDPFAALDTLVALGVTRVLTSGQSKTALTGADNLCEFREYAAGRIEILAGGGIRAHNVREIIKRTGCTQVHLGPMTTRIDPTSSSPNGTNYGGDGEITVAAVAEVVKAITRNV